MFLIITFVIRIQNLTDLEGVTLNVRSSACSVTEGFVNSVLCDGKICIRLPFGNL